MTIHAELSRTATDLFGETVTVEVLERNGRWRSQATGRGMTGLLCMFPATSPEEAERLMTNHLGTMRGFHLGR